MYYPQDMTKEDIEAFELDMAAIDIRWDELAVNWELQEIAEGA
jgi:hypothetical protein